MTKTIPRSLRHSTLLLLLLAWTWQGCSSTKTVPEGDALFAGFEVKVNDEKDSSKRGKTLETELSATVKPQPNASILGMRPKLWIYNAFYTEKEKGVKNWIQNKLGEPPVLLSEVDTSSINNVMHARLHNRGYFYNTVQSDTTIKKKMATIKWSAEVHEPYRIRKIEYTLNDSLPIQGEIRSLQSTSFLKKGEPYDLDKMLAERARIDLALKNKGYFFFGPDMLIFSADTTVGGKQVDVLMRLKEATPALALRPYRIEDVFINANYNLNDSLSVSDTLRFEGYNYIPNENYVRAKHIMQGVFIEKDSVYSRRNHLLTVNRLMGLSAYKFVNLQYERDTTREDRLDAFIYMTPALKKSLRAEVQMVSKSNNLAGPGVSVSFRNRNAFKGSEMLTLDLTGRFENQIGGGRSSSESGDNNPVGLNAFELGAQASLTLPRLVSPFKLPNLRSEFVPKTRMSLGFNYLNRVEFFQMNSINASYAYNWRPKQTITHDFTPINLLYVKLGNTTEYFDSVLTQNTFLRRSFEEQFIIGSIYQFTFSTLSLEKRRHQFFSSATLDVSGNTVNAIQSLLGSEKRDESAEPPVPARTVFGQAYSQYTRIDNDFRYYYNISEETQLATRLIAGVGFPYGNSLTMPYVKQFSIGGPYSIRAFRARSIGPGTYNVPDSLAFSFFDQTGDIKLEANVEYRFPIAGFFKGAVFVDAGNIWLIRETVNDKGEVDRPGGKFKASNILGELAVGTGFGLRVDVEFFVIRFDLGIPVRVPYLPAGERTVLSDLKFGFNPGPGEYGMVLNIAIGYPF